MSLTDMLAQEIADLGGPMVELDPEQWSSLARRIEDLAVDAPPPPSFPVVASQIVSLASKPDVDLNQLVGLVSRDGAIASSLLRVANSAAFAPAVVITSLRDAIGMLGIKHVVEVVLGTAGRSYYTVASRAELELFPLLWQTMFDEAMANAFSAGRLALDVRDARGERTLLAGLLIDVGRPIALRMLARLIIGAHGTPGIEKPSEAVVLATLDEVAPALGKRVIAAMGLPEELASACIVDRERPTPDAQIARLVGAIGAIQRRSPRLWSSAGEVRAAAERLELQPRFVRALFAQRSQDVISAAAMFSSTPAN
ncbi:MAG: HDOD domain-containing protein [Kofleriaceae bacterium]|nr:HDOD domain-containing protein [Kofleriaceae bacterium]